MSVARTRLIQMYLIFLVTMMMVINLFSDLKGHMLQKHNKLTLIGSLKDIDVKDCSHGALYPNVCVYIDYKV
jgi:hypothetical protein